MQTSLKADSAHPDSSQLTRLKDEHFERQVVRYKAWLAMQRRQHHDEMYHEMQEYAGRAMTAVEVGNNRIQTFAPFRYKYSALQTIVDKQVIFIGSLTLAWIGAMLWNWKLALAWTISLITLGYLSHLVLDVCLALRVVSGSSEEHTDMQLIEALQDADWPPYTILCPLYKEAQVVPQFVKAMQAIDYPADKLQILFLTEEDDTETRQAILSLHLPPNFKIITVPDGKPRTKPRACNYGLIEATGQYVVIYDAEDIPDPLQLKKAVLTFANHGPELACVQAKLNFYNPQQNLLTRWFTAEYSLWFDLILPGLQKGKLAIPLGGTSNHFPTQALRALGGWDAFNVTEDCDLGLRLSWFHLKTVIVDSTTYEEANSRVKNWIRQRSRWIKGYMQTYLVHMREPMHYLRDGRWRELFSLQVLIGGKTAILLINPLMWLLFALTLIFHQQTAQAFATLFPAFVLYLGVITLILGNFFYGYIYLLGCMHREQFRLVKWVLLVPAYWVLTSVAAYMALYELFTRPHYWQKTTHGLHLKTGDAESEIDQEWEELAKLAESLTPLPATTKTPLTHGTGFAAPVQKYARLENVPVASVQDRVEMMIAPRKPALLPSERAYLEQSKRAKKDGWLITTAVTAMVLSIAACVYFFKQHQLLLFGAVISQLNAAHSLVFESPLLDFTRLDGTNLPLPTLLMTPFAWNDYLWHTGLAGSIPSMACYTLTAIYLFLSVRALIRNSIVSYLGALIFMLNPTILYLQSTPANDLVCIATLTLTCYYMLAWIQNDTLGNLLKTAGSACLATLCRYDAWIFLAILFVIILLAGLIKRHKWERITSNLLVFSILGGLGIALWVAWCWIIFKDPIYFMHTRFVKQAISQSPTLSTYHDIWRPLHFYMVDALETLGPIVGIPALFATALFLVRSCFKREMFAALVFLVPIAIYVAALYNTQLLPALPLSIPLATQDSLFKANLGAELVVPAAILIAALIGSWNLEIKKKPA
ncbi:MAG TPA: glycosyltransferase [Ktedonobacteraceae bacterium]|nr:glycosyltransferase [Ktedonobacteraceae bacterium]